LKVTQPGVEPIYTLDQVQHPSEIATMSDKHFMVSKLQLGSKYASKA